MNATRRPPQYLHKCLECGRPSHVHLQAESAGLCASLEYKFGYVWLTLCESCALKLFMQLGQALDASDG